MSSPILLDRASVELSTFVTLGIGSYGKVCKAKYGQLPCAAKLLHDTLFHYGETSDFTLKFEKECQFLSTINHPNIVQYLGTSRDPESDRPILLMELMDESLTNFLKRSPAGPLPYHIQVNICHDVALALSYLHLNGIIHRDLSSNNVLLIGEGSRAKVTDFGMSKLMDINPHFTPLTQCPGTPVYMPPEAVMTVPQYSDKLDCFSFGVLTIQVVTKKIPNPGIAGGYVEDSRYPSGRVLVQFPEMDRRKGDIELIDPDHSLLPIALQCLKDRDTERPSSDELCEKLSLLAIEERHKHSAEEIKSQKDLIRELKLKLKESKEVISNLSTQLQIRTEKSNDVLVEKSHAEELDILKREIKNYQKDLKESRQSFKDEREMRLKLEGELSELQRRGIGLEEDVETQASGALSPSSVGTLFYKLKGLFSPNWSHVGILVLGREGTGKSLLINGIMGSKIAKEADGWHKSSGIIKIDHVRGSMKLTFWKASGLHVKSEEARDNYVQKMRNANCTSSDLVLYCTRMDEDPYLGEVDTEALGKFTEGFGKEIWENAIVVLTFANCVDIPKSDSPELSLKETNEEQVLLFKRRIEKCTNEFKTALRQLHVPEEVVSKVKYVPAGYNEAVSLPDCVNWLSHLIHTCVTSMKPASQDAFMKMISQRIEHLRGMNEGDTMLVDFGM